MTQWFKGLIGDHYVGFVMYVVPSLYPERVSLMMSYYLIGCDYD